MMLHLQHNTTNNNNWHLLSVQHLLLSQNSLHAHLILSL